jgi:hypothetical protein
MQYDVNEATLIQLENATNAILDDRSEAMATPITTKKYLTRDNRLVYLTKCTVAESAVPNLRIQIFERIHDGVRETSYALFADRRFEQTINLMLFSERPGPGEMPKPTPVDESTALSLIDFVGRLSETDRRT